MKKIDVLMKKGENNLTSKEAEELRTLALAAQSYEKSIYTIPAPKTLEGLIELKMYEKKKMHKQKSSLLGYLLFRGVSGSETSEEPPIIVVWGGIEPPTQGFSVLCSTD